jgi:hypothetical protein
MRSMRTLPRTPRRSSRESNRWGAAFMPCPECPRTDRPCRPAAPTNRGMGVVYAPAPRLLRQSQIRSETRETDAMKKHPPWAKAQSAPFRVAQRGRTRHRHRVRGQAPLRKTQVSMRNRSHARADHLCLHRHEWQVQMPTRAPARRETADPGSPKLPGVQKGLARAQTTERERS